MPHLESICIAAFGQYLIKPGHLPVELGTSLNQVQRIRQLADYTGEEVTNEVARQAVEQANSFVEKIRQKLGLIA